MTANAWTLRSDQARVYTHVRRVAWNTGTVTTPLPPQVQALIGKVNSGGTSSSSDLYGLGEWGTQNIPTGDLPFPIKTGPKGNADGNNIIAAFAQAGTTSISTIQHALLLGGFYGTNSTYVPTYGILKPQDLTAFGAAVTIAGKQKAPVADVLLAAADQGTKMGIASAAQAVTSQKTTVASVEVPNAQNLESAAQTAFENALGRKPTQAEAARFAASYQANAVGVERANNASVYEAKAAAKGDAGLNDQQVVGDLSLLGQSAQPTPFQQHIADQGPSAQVPSGEADAPPSFAAQLNSLGEIAQKVAGQANPTTTGGLNQVDESDVESPSVAAANFARNTNPEAAGAADLASTFQNFLSIIQQNFAGSS